MNPGVVAQYGWPLLILAGAALLFAGALAIGRRRGLLPPDPWSWTRAAAPPDELALHRTLMVLLALAVLSGAVPLFATAFVFRWFNSLKVLALVLAALAALAVPVLLVWRATPPAGMEPPAPRARPVASLMVLAAALVLLGTLGAGYRAPAPPAALLALGAGCIGLAALVGAGGLGVSDAGVREARLGAMAHWTVCATAILLALLATAFTAQTLDVALLGQAQANTRWYALLQPLAMAAFLVAAALVLHPAARHAVLGAGSRLRSAAELAVVLTLGGMFAAAFLAGPSGPWLPGPVWLLLKAVAAAALIVALGRRLRMQALGRATRLAWAAAGLALLNVALTAVVLALRARAAAGAGGGA